jgi:mRNA interferase MazF
MDPAVGHEIKKTRPAVIVTSDRYNQYNWVVQAVPITSADSAEYDQVLIRPPEGGLTKASVTVPDQLRVVDRSRLVRKMGELNKVTMLQIDNTLRVVLDL